MKRFFTGIALSLALLINSYAAELTSTLTFGTNWITTGGKTVTGLRLVSTNTMVVSLYDGNTNRNTYTNAAYTTRQTYSTNMVSTTTNSLGVIQSITNVGVFSTSLSVAQNTAAPLPVLLSVTCSPNVVTEIEGLAARFIRGIVAATTSSTPESNAVLTVIYQ